MGDQTMEMDDDDFMGNIEFELTQEQGMIVQRAIDIAANTNNDEFVKINPLIAIMQWWESNVSEREKRRGTAEATLAEACRLYVIAHEKH
jgi:hypothetical protein